MKLYTQDNSKEKWTNNKQYSFGQHRPDNGVLPPELMPRTKDASVSILGTLPMPYYNSLHPKTVNDVFDSPSCSIAVINKKVRRAAFACIHG